MATTITWYSGYSFITGHKVGNDSCVPDWSKKCLLKCIPKLSLTVQVWHDPPVLAPGLQTPILHYAFCRGWEHLRGSDAFSPRAGSTEVRHHPVAVCKKAHLGWDVGFFYGECSILTRNEKAVCSVLECACNCQIKMYKVSNLSNFSPRLCLIPSICLPCPSLSSAKVSFPQPVVFLILFSFLQQVFWMEKQRC